MWIFAEKPATLNLQSILFCVGWSAWELNLHVSPFVLFSYLLTLGGTWTQHLFSELWRKDVSAKPYLQFHYSLLLNFSAVIWTKQDSSISAPSHRMPTQCLWYFHRFPIHIRKKEKQNKITPYIFYLIQISISWNGIFFRLEYESQKRQNEERALKIC